MGEKGNEERKNLRLQSFDYSSNRAYFVTVCTKNRQRLLCDIKKGINGNDAVLIHAPSQAKVSGLTKHHHRVGSDGRSVGATLCGRPGNPHEMIVKWFRELERKFDGAWIDLAAIMPDHVHFIVVIHRSGERAEETACFPGDHTGSPLQGDGERVVEDARIPGDHAGSPLQGDGERAAEDARIPGDHTGSPLQGDGARAEETACVSGDHTKLLATSGATYKGETTSKRSEYDLFDIVGWFKTMVTNEYIRGVKVGIYQPFDKKLWQRGYYEHIIRNDDDLYEVRRYISENPVRWLIDEKEPFELKETKVE